MRCPECQFDTPRHEVLPYLPQSPTADSGFASRFYRALAMYLSITVRERHRALGYGSGTESMEIEDDDADELDTNVLDGVCLTRERFDRMVKRVMAA